VKDYNASFSPVLFDFLVDSGIVYILTSLQCKNSDTQCAKWASQGGNRWHFVAIRFAYGGVYITPKILFDADILSTNDINAAKARAIIVSPNNLFILDGNDLLNVTVVDGLATIVGVSAAPENLIARYATPFGTGGRNNLITFFTKEGIATIDAFTGVRNLYADSFTPNYPGTDPRVSAYIPGHWGGPWGVIYVANASGCNNCVPPTSLWQIETANNYRTTLVDKSQARQYGTGCNGSLSCALGWSSKPAILIRSGWLVYDGGRPLALTMWTQPTFKERISFKLESTGPNPDWLTILAMDLTTFW